MIPAAGFVWSSVGLRRSWFFYDEWAMIDRVMHTNVLDGLSASFNGHLWMISFLVYRVQVSWFGVGSHAFVGGVLIGSLVAMHVALTALLRACSVPLLVSLLSASLVTYFGVGSQNSIFAFQAPINLAIALSAVSATLVLTRPPSGWNALIVAVLLLLSVGADSGTALPWVCFAAVVLAQAWRNRYAWCAAPALLGLGVWLLAGDLGPSQPGSLIGRVKFSLHLLLESSGGLVGGAETAGILVLLASAMIVWVGRRRQAITRPAWIVFGAGTGTAVLMVGSIAQARAALVGSDFVNYNRYLQAVAVPLFIGLLPAVSDSLRSLFHRLRPQGPIRFWSALTWAVPSLMILISFNAGLDTRRAYVAGFDYSNLAVEAASRTAAVVIRDGCPVGRRLDLTSSPAAGLSPQMSTQLLVEVIARQAYRAPHTLVVDPVVVDRMCGPMPEPSGAP